MLHNRRPEAVAPQGVGSVAASKASWFVITLLTAGLALQPGGCAGPLDPGKDEPRVDADLLAELLLHTQEGVMVPELETMEVHLEELEVAVVAWSVAPEDPSARAAAQAAYEGALVQWGVLDALQVGPGASSLASPAGEDLRDEVYSWPTVNPCRVDQETVSGDFASDGFFEQELVNVYGLDALEHLLYAPEENACPSQVDINAEGLWEGMGPGVVAASRADYALAVVERLQADVGGLSGAWAGSFGDDFVEGSGPYGSAEEALDDLFRAVFYVEAMKDEKLAFPLGLRECGAAACPEMAESQVANLSADLLRANLKGLAAVLAPADGVGFAELLDDAGENELADTLRTKVLDAETALAPLSSVRDDVADDDGSVLAAYDAVVSLANLLEGDVATVLTLTVPSEAAGDAD